MKTFQKKILALAVATCASTAYSAGFYLQEQSVSGLGVAFAGQVATANDASVTYFNPAAMTKLEGTHFNLGLHLISPEANITDNGSTISSIPLSAALPAQGLGYGDGGNPYKLSPIPNFSVSYQATDDLWLGVNFSVPFGLASNYDADFFARYDSLETKLQTIDLALLTAYKFNDKWSIGGGINIQHADAELKSNLYLPASLSPTGAPLDTQNVLSGNNTEVGFNIGLLFSPSLATDVGLHYRSKMNHQINGNITVPAQSLNNLPGTVELNLPDIAQLGFNHRLNSSWTLLGGITWFGWSNFETLAPALANGIALPETLQNYKDTLAFALGAEYVVNKKLTLRGGVQFDETPTVDEFRTTRTPDGDRTWLSAGATYKLTHKMSVNLAATYIDVAEGTIDLTRNSGAVNIKAKSEGKVMVFGAALNYKF